MKSTSYGSYPGITADNAPLSIHTAQALCDPRLQLIATDKGIPNLAGGFIHPSLTKTHQRAHKADLRHLRAWAGSIPSLPSRVAQCLMDHAGSMR